LESAARGDLTFHLTLNGRLDRADSNLRNTGVNLRLFGGVIGFFRQETKSDNMARNETASVF